MRSKAKNIKKVWWGRNKGWTIEIKSGRKKVNVDKEMKTTKGK